jgi:curli biogenesis system outer membrane secretion channel CsgG
MKHTFLLSLLIIHSFYVFSQETLVLKKRIAVAPFENSFQTSNIGGVQQNSGSAYTQLAWDAAAKAITDNLTTELVESGQFEVFERNQINSILLEQGLGEEGKVTQQSVAKIGQLLGVEIMIMGSVTEYGSQEFHETINIGPIAKRESAIVAKVSIDLRLVNTTTGQIMVAKRATGIDSTKTSGAAFGGFGRNKQQTDVYRDQVNLDNAKSKALKTCVGYIVEAMQNIAWGGKVIIINSDKTVIVKPGSSSGVKLGDIFDVYSKGDEIIDPDTGLSLGSQEKKIGSIKITEFIGDGQASKAAIISGSLKKGDILRLPN